jgi:hypothetical protein
LFSLARLRSCAIAFASSAAIALVLASTLAAGDGVDSDQDGVPDNLEDATQRTVAASSSGDQFNVSSHLGGSAVQDQFEFWYWPGHFGVYYGVQDGASITYNLELRNLLEWKDANYNGRMDNAEILRTTPLGAAAFSGVGVGRSEWRDSDGGHVYNFAVSSRDRQVSMNVTIAQRFTRLDSLTLTPMEARMDLQIQPVLSYQDSGVALEFLFETSPGNSVVVENRSWDEQQQFAPSEHALNVTGSAHGRSASAFFSWANEPVVSGQSTTIGYAYQRLDSKSYNLTLAYPPAGLQAITVAHQMAFGIRSVAFDSIEGAPPPTPALQPDLFLFAGTFAGVAGLVALTVVLSSRRRVQRGDEGRKP